MCPEVTSSATRRELGEQAYGVLVIDVIAVVIGGLESRQFGRGMWLAGLGLAAYVTVCFAVVIGGNLAIEYLVTQPWRRKPQHAG